MSAEGVGIVHTARTPDLHALTWLFCTYLVGIQVVYTVQGVGDRPGGRWAEQGEDGGREEDGSGQGRGSFSGSGAL